MTCLSFSPQSCTENWVLVGSCEDNTLLIFNSQRVQTLSPSFPIKERITEIKFDKTDGTCIALLTEDSYLIFFKVTQDLEKEHEWVIPLNSRGVSVCFHPFSTDHVLIAEETGAIRFFNLAQQEWMLSVFEPGILHSADWNLKDPNVFGAIIGNSWYVWDLSLSPLHVPHYSGDSQGSLTFKYYFH